MLNYTYPEQLVRIHYKAAMKPSLWDLLPWTKKAKELKSLRLSFCGVEMLNARDYARQVEEINDLKFKLIRVTQSRDRLKEELDYANKVMRENRVGFYKCLDLK